MVREQCPCLQLSDGEAGVEAGKRLAPWKTKGNGLITYISRGGENKEVKALHISARGSMSETGVALTGWFTRCCRKMFYKEGRVVTWKSKWETRLQEMKLILEGFQTLMSMFDVKDVVAYFRRGSLPASHVHAHAVAKSSYWKEDGDEYLEDIIEQLESVEGANDLPELIVIHAGKGLAESVNAEIENALKVTKAKKDQRELIKAKKEEAETEGKRKCRRRKA